MPLCHDMACTEARVGWEGHRARLRRERYTKYWSRFGDNGFTIRRGSKEATEEVVRCDKCYMICHWPTSRLCNNLCRRNNTLWMWCPSIRCPIVMINGDRQWHVPFYQCLCQMIRRWRNARLSSLRTLHSPKMAKPYQRPFYSSLSE